MACQKIRGGFDNFMLGAIKKAKSDAKKVIADGMASSSMIKNIGVASTFVTKPYQALTWTFLLKSVYDALGDPKETEDAMNTFSKDELKLITLCCALSRASYHPEKAELPPEAGQMIFSPGSVVSTAVPFYVYECKETNTAFLVCRGSACINDFVTDLNASAVDIYGGLMHAGVVRAVLAVYAIVKDKLVQIHKSGRKLYFTGHSLGGAVAAGLCHKLRREFPEIDAQAYVFGSAASLSKNLWLESRKFCKCFVMSGDGIPYLSFHNVAQLSAENVPFPVACYIKEVVKRDVVRPALQVPVIDMDSNPFQQPPPTLESILQSIELENSMRTTALFPPGQHYLIELSGDLFKTVTLRRIPDCEYFGAFVKGISTDTHAMTIYAQSMEKLSEQLSEKQ